MVIHSDRFDRANETCVIGSFYARLDQNRLVLQCDQILLLKKLLPWRNVKCLLANFVNG